MSLLLLLLLRLLLLLLMSLVGSGGLRRYESRLPLRRRLIWARGRVVRVCARARLRPEKKTKWRKKKKKSSGGGGK